MRQSQQILGVEIVRMTQLGRNDASQEVSLEVHVVRDDRTAGEYLLQPGRDLTGRRSVAQLAVGQPGEALYRAGKWPRRPHESGQGGDIWRHGINQQNTVLEQLGSGILGKSRRLEVDEGQRPKLGCERCEGGEVDTDRCGVAPQDRRCVRRRSRLCTPDPAGSAR